MFRYWSTAHEVLLMPRCDESHEYRQGPVLVGPRFNRPTSCQFHINYMYTRYAMAHFNKKHFNNSNLLSTMLFQRLLFKDFWLNSSYSKTFIQIQRFKDFWSSFGARGRHCWNHHFRSRWSSMRAMIFTIIGIHGVLQRGSDRILLFIFKLETEDKSSNRPRIQRES